MPTMNYRGAALPTPPIKDAPEPVWNSYWGLCHGIIQKIPDPEGMKYKTHTIVEENGVFFPSIDYDYNEAPAATSVIPAAGGEEQTPEQFANGMHERGDLAVDNGGLAPADPSQVPGSVPALTPEVLPPAEKPKKTRAKKPPKATVPQAFTGAPPASSTAPAPTPAVAPDIAAAPASGEVVDMVKLTTAIAESAGLPKENATVADLPAGHAERKHHQYSMSRLNHLDDCPGFESGGSNEAADEGTALHEIVEAILQAWLEFNATEERPITLVDAFERAVKHGLTMPDGITAMEDGQKDAVRDVLKEIDWQIPGAVEVYIEERLPLVHPDGTQLNNGHIDLVLGFPGGKCTVIDYKFGRAQVRDASRNYQGFGYAISFLQAHPEYSMAKILFIQPRINFKSEHPIIRSDIPGLYYKIRMLIEDAQNPKRRLRAGDQCRYCAMADRCPELANYVSRVGASYSNLPMPTTFHGTEITDPVQMALALFWAKRAEPAIEGIKKAATEMAKQGMDLTMVLPSGQTVTYEVHDKAQPRQLGEAPLIFQAVRDVLSPEEFTACVDVRLGDLETVYAETLQARRLADTGEKITKVAAVEKLNAILAAEGLVSRPEGRTYWLKEIRTELAVKQVGQN